MNKPSFRFLLSSWKSKHLLSALICLIALSYGMCQMLIGVTIIDLKVLLGTNMQQISHGFVICSSFNCVSSVLWGIAFKRWIDRRHGLILALLLCGISIAVLPHLRTLAVYFVFMAMLGVAYSALGLAINSWTIELWPENSNSRLQLVYFCMSIGYTLSPLMSEPFLAPENVLNTTLSHDREISSSRIAIPHFVCSSLVFMTMFSLIIVVIAVKPGPDSKRNHSEQCSNLGQVCPSQSRAENLSNPYRFVVVGLGAVISCFTMTYSENMGYYLMTFLNNVGQAKSMAARIMSVFGLAFTAARVISIFLATKMRPGTMLAIDLILVFVGSLCVLIFGATYDHGLWLGVITMAIGTASVQGALYAFVGERVPVTDLVAGILSLGAGVGPIVYPFIDGPFIDSKPFVFVYINVGCIVMSYLALGCIFMADVSQKRAQAVKKLPTFRLDEGIKTVDKYGCELEI